MSRGRDRLFWQRERKCQALNEVIPAGEMLEGKRSKHQPCPTTEENERKGSFGKMQVV